MKVLVRGGRVVDPSQGLDARRDLLIADGRVESLLESGASVEADEIVDAAGLVVAPGFVDIGARLGEPGFEYRESIATGLAAAAAGGYTTVACSPHTDPVLDDASVVEHVLAAAGRSGLARVRPLAAATRGLAGVQLAEYGLLRRAGAVAFSNGQRPIADAGVLRRALLHAQHPGAVVLHRPEDPALAAGGVMHEGTVSALLGLAGVPASAEATMLARDLLVVEETGGRYHLSLLSTARGASLLREAKRGGAPISADVGIAHLVLTDEAVRDQRFATSTKLQPPLRSAADRAALREALADGTIDAIVSHHVPLHPDEKLESFDRAPFGAVGLETAVSLALHHLVRSGSIALARMVELFSTGPARALGLDDAGSLAVGAVADVTLLDLEASWIVEPSQLRSRSRNTPFAGASLVGRPVGTLLGGRRITLPARAG